MKVMDILKIPKFLWNHCVCFYWNHRNSHSFINYLRDNNVKIGNRCFAKRPWTIMVDLTRPELIEIGNHVFLHEGTTIMTHDWASWCFVEKYNDFIPAHGRIKIGNNVWLGMNVTILGG